MLDSNSAAFRATPPAILIRVERSGARKATSGTAGTMGLFQTYRNNGTHITGHYNCGGIIAAKIRTSVSIATRVASPTMSESVQLSFATIGWVIVAIAEILLAG
jgi:hypothetical protein